MADGVQEKIQANYDNMQNELLELKAKTMYRMVEDIDIVSKKKKVVFLRNNQAQHLVDDSINEDGKGIELLMKALELRHQPEMVINLLGSCGFPEWYRQNGARGGGAYGKPSNILFGNPGTVKDMPPFDSAQSSREVEARIDTFMSEVLIPRAEETHALVITEALNGDCILSMSFNRMCEMRSAKWTNGCPFTTIACTGLTNMLYMNPNKKAIWREIRLQSKSWKQADEELTKVYKDKEFVTLEAGLQADKKAKAAGQEPPAQEGDVEVPRGPDGIRKGVVAPIMPDLSVPCYPDLADLDPNAQIYLVVGAVTKTKYTEAGVTKFKSTPCDKGPFNALRNEIVRYFAKQLPSIAIKTGFSTRCKLDQVAGKSASLGPASASCRPPSAMG